MQGLRKRRKQSDANFTVPFDLTTNLLAQLRKNLSPSIKTDYLFEQITSKFVSRDTAPALVRRTAAIRKWLSTERNNEATNVRLFTVDPGYNILPRVTYESFMGRVRSIIQDVIGEVVPNEALEGGFSGGATTSRSRTNSHPGEKYIGKADVTLTCLHYAESLLEDSPVWRHYRSPEEYRIVEGNVLFTVPKTTDIDRCACKEPDINMYFQKGVGNVIRQKLRYFGIDLNDQSRNQRLARVGSSDGSLATVDLSSASDSISRELVLQCLPTLWYGLLDDLRSPVTIIDGERHVNEMFSSMGNGFTFELESLLFYAIARAVAWVTGTSGTISVYGDDIIVPTQMCQDLIFVLSFLGFETNKEKTFFEGPFRESCGGHYYNGSCVTPFYIREPISSLRQIILIANQLRKWATIEGLPILDCEVEEAWQLLAEKVPKCFWGGYDLDDASRLVTAFQPDKPKYLKPISDNRSLNEGGYIYWHDLKDKKPQMEALQTSIKTSNSSLYRSKPVKWFFRCTDRVFLTELR